MADTAYPKGPREELEAAHPDAELQTDKAMAKVVPCVGCGKEIIVNQFYAPAWAKCSACGHQTRTAGTGEAKIVQAGRTDPEKAQNLADALINKEFAHADCPLCGAEHPLELKHITQNDNYGPSKLVGHDSKGPIYKTLPGESAVLQCNNCLLCLGISTMHVTKYRRQNEPKVGIKTRSQWEDMLGPREEAS